MTSALPGMGIFTTDAALVVRVWDDWLAAVTGRSADQMRGRPLAEVVPDLEARGLLRYFQEVLATGAVQVLAPAFHRYLIPCAPPLPSARFTQMQQRVTIGPLREDGRIVGAMATIEDVTVRVDAERDMAEALRSTDPEVRRRAAEAVARLDQTETADVLRPLLGDDDWKVRQAGVTGLARSADMKFVGSLIDTLRDEHHNFSVLSSALKLLALTDVDVTGPVAALLQHRDPDLRMQAALSLGEQQDLAAVPPLIAALADPDLNVRFHAIESLGRLRATAAVEPLLDVIESRDFFLAFVAIDALASINERTIAARLVPVLSDDVLRAPVIDALGTLGEDDVVAPLVGTLNESADSATAVAGALASIHRRSEQQYGAGPQIEDGVRATITEAGTHHLLDALAAVAAPQLASLVTVLSWLHSPEVDRALARLLGETAVRTQVMEALARNGRRVVPLLLEQLAADDRATRLAAIAALGRIGDRRASDALLQGLDDDAEAIVATAGALARIADPAAFEPLVSLVSHPDATVRLAAIGALNSIGHPETPDRVAMLLGDADARTRESAVRIAGYFGYRETAERLLVAAHGDADEAVRRAAIEHLPYLDDVRVPQALVTALGAEAPKTRAAAVRALARLDDPAATTALRRGLADPDLWVRYHAARALGERRDAAAADTLIALADRDAATPVRIAAVEALGAIGAGTTAHLKRWATDPEQEVAAAALQGLGRLAEDETLRPLLEVLKSDSPTLRIATVRALAAHGSAGAVDALEWTVSADREIEIAAAAVEGLGAVASAGGAGAASAVEALLSLLGDARTREAVITALSRLPSASIPAVERGLTHDVPAVRLGTVDALARLRHPDATSALEAALEHGDASIREAAVRALARLGATGAAAAVALLSTQDPSKAVRRAAAVALLRLHQPPLDNRPPA